MNPILFFAVVQINGLNFAQDFQAFDTMQHCEDRKATFVHRVEKLDCDKLHITPISVCIPGSK